LNFLKKILNFFDFFLKFFLQIVSPLWLMNVIHLGTGGDQSGHAGDAPVCGLRFRGLDVGTRSSTSYLPADQRLTRLTSAFVPPPQMFLPLNGRQLNEEELQIVYFCSVDHLWFLTIKERPSTE
jgi:hypothetical protein